MNTGNKVFYMCPITSNDEIRNNQQDDSFVTTNKQPTFDENFVLQ